MMRVGNLTWPSLNEKTSWNMNHFISLWDETRKRCQSRFSASTSLTSNSYSQIIIFIGSFLLSLPWNEYCTFTKANKVVQYIPVLDKIVSANTSTTMIDFLIFKIYGYNQWCVACHFQHLTLQIKRKKSSIFSFDACIFFNKNSINMVNGKIF